MKLAVIPVVLAAACAVPEEDVVTTVEQTLKCDDFMCGTNSPVIGGRGFWELSLHGDANAQGLKITGFRNKDGKPYKLKVQAGRFIGESSDPDVPLLEHAALKGSRIYVKADDVLAYVIEIAEVETTEYWAKLGSTSVTLETYLLKYSELSGDLPKYELGNLCNKAIAKPDMKMNGEHTTVFEGERIDAKAKRIAAKLEPQWVNFGCAGSALAKLQLIGYTEAAKANGFPSTIDQRQAALKMLTADYCGKGTPMTIAGQPLDLKDARDTLRFKRFTTLEARWTKDGASCLNTPRVEANPSPEADEAFPLGIGYAIYKSCLPGFRPPPCEGTGLGGHDLISGNPLVP